MNSILITGANGEVGHGLITALSGKRQLKIITLDLNPLEKPLLKQVFKSYTGNILDKHIMAGIFKSHKFDTIFHLASILSTSGEKNPILAHEVNIGGTISLLEMARLQSEKNKKIIKFIFPSSIAAYGIPDIKTKQKAGKVKEDQYLNPITMYGINKLYCELLGSYFSSNFQQLISNRHFIDFRCVRFPGLISSQTIPSGGTSDYAPEMIHAAAQGKAYQCFVRPDSKIPFMAMPDAINSLLLLTNAAKNKLTQIVYNVGGFSATAGEIEIIVKKNFPRAKITYKINNPRQKIVDSWPEDVDDSKAKKDWNWEPNYDFKHTFTNYLIPEIRNRYQ